MSRVRALFGASVAVGILAACSGGDPASPTATASDAGGTDATVDGSSSGSVDSAPPDVAAPDTGPGTGPIACGKVPTCDSKTQDCCLEAPLACAPKGTCPGGSLSCSDTASCAAGSVCCATVVRADGGAGDAGDAGDGGGGGGATVNAACEAACTKAQLQLCATTADCTVAGEECRRGPGGLFGCRKALDGGADGGSTDASDGG